MKCWKNLRASNKIFLLLVLCTILTSPIWLKKLEEYLLISAINDSSSSLKEIKDGNVLVISGIKGKNLPQTGAPYYYGKLENDRALTKEEFDCMTDHGIFSAAVVEGKLEIICYYGKTKELLYIN